MDVADERELIARNPMVVNRRRRKLRTPTPRRSYIDRAEQLEALLAAAGQLIVRRARISRRRAGRSSRRSFGHTDARLTLRVYARAMSQREGEQARLQALVDGR